MVKHRIWSRNRCFRNENTLLIWCPGSKYRIRGNGLLHVPAEARKGMEAVAEHINEMQKIYEEYGAIFDELAKMFKDLYPLKKVSIEPSSLFSYKFVKGFLAITFLLLVFSNWNFHNVCQRFLYNQEQNFSWILQKMRNFPIDPHYKNRPLL